LLKRLEHVADNGGALLGIFGDPDPSLLADLDDKRVAAARMQEVSAVYQRIVAGAAAWSIVGFPTPRWAGLVFGDPDVEHLWKAIAHTVRLDEPDPEAAWNEHIERLEGRAERLHELHLAAVRFVGPGTDLLVRLHPTSRWHTARHQSASGILHVANMPTEEIFTTPDARGTEGVVRATYPLNMSGTTVDGLELVFQDGRVTEVRASRGEGFIREHIGIDDGAARLGEVALVDRNSRIGRSGLVFHNGLFDENAASHIALGAGWTPAVAGASDLDPHELHERGINQSLVHTDFMIGAPEVRTVGVTSDGDELALLDDGEWVAR
jgi:aminopeptidase